MLKLLDRDFNYDKNAFKYLMEIVDNMYREMVYFSRDVFSRKC